jgi:hypothetical protein
MATTKKNAGGKSSASAAKQQAREKEKNGGRVPSTLKTVAIVAVPVVLVLVLFFFVILPSQVTVPFSTFKSNFEAAQRVAVVLMFNNQTRYVAELQCAPQLIQAIAYTRNRTTIDYYQMNATECLYQLGLGEVTPLNATTGSCLGMISSEPAVILNYSSTDYSVVTAYKLYVHGNAQFMQACPIAVDIS